MDGYHKRLRWLVDTTYVYNLRRAYLLYDEASKTMADEHNWSLALLSARSP